VRRLLTGRRRRIAVVAAVATVAAIVLAVALGGSRDDAPPSSRDAAVAYAAAWQRACVALRDAERRAHRELAAPGADAEDVVDGWLRAADAALAPLSGARPPAARPPAAWSAYHREVVRALGPARRRIAAARGRLTRDGAAAALRDAQPGPLPRTPDAPADLRRRTPACVGAGSSPAP